MNGFKAQNLLQHPMLQRSQSFNLRNYNKSGDLGESKEKLVNIQRKEKLKNLLIVKFMKKYGLNDVEPLLEGEVSSLLSGQKLSDQDLKKLDTRLKGILQGKASQSNTHTQNSLNKKAESSKSVKKINDDQESLKKALSGTGLPNIDDLNKEVMIKSNMSVYSKTSKASEQKQKNAFRRSESCDFDDMSVSNRSKKNPVFLDGKKGDDYWGAIARYNQRKFEEEKVLNKIKDKEIKKRVKEDLDKQVREKYQKKSDELVNNREFDDVVMRHVENLNQLEREKDYQKRLKILREKESRDLQIKDERLKKKKEVLQNIKFEKETVHKMVEEIEKEKETALAKKRKEKDVLLKLLEENKVRRTFLAEKERNEKENDMEIVKNLQKIMDQQERDRADYFKLRERKSPIGTTRAIEAVINNINSVRKSDDDKISKYLQEKEQKAQEEDLKKKEVMKLNRFEMKTFLDKQIEEKKKQLKFEKNINNEQGKLWQEDTLKFYDQQKELENKIRKMNKENCAIVKLQIDRKKMNKKDPNNEMTETEMLLNQNLIRNLENKDIENQSQV